MTSQDIPPMSSGDPLEECQRVLDRERRWATANTASYAQYRIRFRKYAIKLETEIESLRKQIQFMLPEHSNTGIIMKAREILARPFISQKD